MQIYIDAEYKCYVTDDGTRRAFEVSFFDGKAKAFIEGYRYIPPGERLVKPNGEFFRGEMITPWINYQLLAAFQTQYEESLSQLAALRAENDDKTAALAAIYSGEV